MPLISVKCRFLMRDQLQTSEPQAITVSAIQDMPLELPNEWLQAIIEKGHLDEAGQDEARVTFQSNILSLDGKVDIQQDQVNEDTETLGADYQPLTDVIAALRRGDQTMSPSINTTVQPEVARNIQHTDSLRLLYGNPLNYDNGLEAALGTLANASIVSVAKLQYMIHHLGPAMLECLQRLSAWIRANRYLAVGFFSGITTSALAFATPLLLGIVGFSGIGPVAGTLAAAWQASIGSVVAGTPFALLQSAAMGGAAMSAVTGIGAASAGVAVASVLASNDTVGRMVKHVQKFVEKEVLGVFIPNTQRFFQGLFGRRTTDESVQTVYHSTRR